ncbi:steroid 17-alpha-hydroxylase/17,20 lyase-like [Carassius gibelio]|uniref:steroid 17-alpha-hydroxylase/17,20 lyase-like n=1 Tax=Carassius gibelio TaxID=101364 RepID=UPI00227889DF|nr:steroid 17-alpha-hydroxylase/17,20 lyase-like [Carassius gibelio]
MGVFLLSQPEGDCGLNTLAACSPQDLSVRHSVTPSDSQDALETADVEVFQGLDVAAVSNPCFTAVEEGGDADCLVQNKVYEELCGVLDVHYPQYSDRHRIPYMCALISEMLRLRPVAPLAVPHRAIRNSSPLFSIAGHFIPKNTIIIPNLYGAHHDLEVWDDPYSFKPERFLEGGGGSLRALIPFGGGARLCLGEAVANMEMFLFTAYLLRDFQFLPASKEEPLPDLRGVASVVLKVKPHTVIAHPREQ